jgi:hypothetical protein
MSDERSSAMSVGYSPCELRADLHRIVKIRAATEGRLIRDLVDAAVAAMYGQPQPKAEAPELEATKPVKRHRVTAADQRADDEARAAREVAESVMRVGRPIASIAEPRDFAVVDDREGRTDARRVVTAIAAIGEDAERNPFSTLK